MPRSRQVTFSILFLIVVVLLLTTYIQNEKMTSAMDHSIKVVYPDLKTTTSELVSLTLPDDVQTNMSSMVDDIEKKDTSQHQQLSKKIDQVINIPQLEGALIGISVRKSTTGELLYSNMGDVRLRPASNMKMLTAIAALKTLGKNYSFSTDVLTDGEVKNNVLKGNIYIRGQGDPTILKDNFDDFAKNLKKQGIFKIDGNIIGDDHWYDDVRYSQDLNWSDEYNYTGTAISALTISPNEDYNAGTVIIQVHPGKGIGDPPKVKVIPETDYIKIVNKAKTVRKADTDGLIIDREHGTNNFRIKGSIPTDSPIEVWRSVWEPTDFSLNIFKKSLVEHGIEISSETMVQRGITPKDSKSLISHQSIPLKELLIPFMKLSNNGHGEILVKEMGKVIYDEGSWDKGLQVMEEQLSSLGINTENISLRDGSGMSFKNLIPPNELTKLLFEIQEEDWYEVFLYSQPIAGESERLVGGTLNDRLTDESTKGKVKAKTGSLTGVSTLSGYLTTLQGEELIFSIMINNYIDGWMPSIQDSIIKVLVEHDF